MIRLRADNARILGSFMIRCLLTIFILVSFVSVSRAEVIINLLAVNPKDQRLEKSIDFSLPGEIKPEDVLDAAGLQIDYNVKDAGYFLHGMITLQSKETKTLRIKVRDVWRITGDQVIELRDEIDRGYKEMGGERSTENAAKLRQRLIDKLNYIFV